MFLVNIASMAQEQIFSIGTNGDIVTKNKFIEELYSGNYNNVTPYTLKFSEKVNAALQTTVNDDLTSYNAKAAKSLNVNKPITAIPFYTVNGLRYKGWDNESGDFNVIEILFGNDTLFTLKYADGWDKSNGQWIYTENGTTRTLRTVGEIVVMKDGKASLVFNKPMIINSIKTNSDGTKTFDLQENTVEWIDENTPANSPITHTMTIKDGNIYFK